MTTLLIKPPKDLKKLSSKTLPYWKDWKKTEQNFLSEAEEIAEEGGEVVVEETVVENAAVLERLEKKRSEIFFLSGSRRNC